MNGLQMDKSVESCMTPEEASTPYKEGRLYLIIHHCVPRLIRRVGDFWHLAYYPGGFLSVAGLPIYEWPEQDKLTPDRVYEILQQVGRLEGRVQMVQECALHVCFILLPDVGEPEVAYRRALAKPLVAQIYVLLKLGLPDHPG